MLNIFYADNIEFLDHFPIVCHLKFETIVNSNTVADEDCKSTERFEQYKWKDESKEGF